MGMSASLSPLKSRCEYFVVLDLVVVLVGLENV